MLKGLHFLNNSRLYSAVAVVLLVIGLYGGSNIEADSVDRTQSLVPVPQKIEKKNGTLTIGSQVNLLGEDTADRDAVRIVKEFLNEHNIVINNEFNEQSTTIALGEEGNLSPKVEELEALLKVSDISNLAEEGYLLKVDAEAADGGVIYLKGKDNDGTFYAAKTFIQLVNQGTNSPSVQNVEILDEPAMEVRGIVEGFYGDPWSHGDRIDQIKFYGDFKMNTYIYAPKDDPYHRHQWRDPYPEHEMDRMEDLIHTANENKVDFVFAISPGNDIAFDGQAGEDDFEALMIKSESLYDMGVRSFSILFDDISNKDGDKQANVLNRFNEEFIKQKKDVKPLITVPTEYDTRAMGVIGDLSDYTKDFSQTLNEDIKVMWTGQSIISDSLPLENFEFMQAVYGDRIGLWWNYPVTDYMKSKLALGPIVDIDPRLEGKLNFFIMNPMEHANLSKISLATGADYSWNTAEYDADQSWDYSIDHLFPELASEMKTFANHSTELADAWIIGREDAREIREAMDRLWLNIATSKDTSDEVAILTQEFTDMIEAANVLKAELPNEIIEESEANLNKLKLLGENGKLALDMIAAQMNEETETYEELKNEISSNLTVLNSGARVSERTVLAFIEEAVNFDPLPSASFKVSKTFIVPGEEIQFENTSSLTAIDFEWVFEGAVVESSKEKNPTAVYEKEGIYSVKLIGKNSLGMDEVIQENLITVSNLAHQPTVNLALNKTATALNSCAPDEGPENTVDGSDRTKWCAFGPGSHTLDIDLGDINLVSEIVIKHAGAGLEPVSGNTSDYRVLISEDGENYTELVEVKGNKDNITRDQVPATKGRYVRLIIDKPAQGTDLAARIYQFEAMGLEGDVDLFGGPDKSALETAISEAVKFDEADYTAESWSAFSSALAAAEGILADDEATQEDVDQVLDALKLAVEGLEKTSNVPGEKPADKSALETAISKAVGLDQSDYTAESWSAFSQALTAAEGILADDKATQEAIDQALDSLQTAIANLQENKKPADPEGPDHNGSENDKNEDVSVEPSDQDKVTDGSKLPSTATNTFNVLAAGIVLLLVGAGLIFVRRRSTNV